MDVKVNDIIKEVKVNVVEEEKKVIKKLKCYCKLILFYIKQSFIQGVDDFINLCITSTYVT